MVSYIDFVKFVKDFIEWHEKNNQNSRLILPFFYTIIEYMEKKMVSYIDFVKFVKVITEWHKKIIKTHV